MFIKAIHRSFAKSFKHSKGAIGNESSLGNNFHFPKHKELFNEGFYDGEDHDYNDNTFESQFSKH
jgi:hypothetical protein